MARLDRVSSATMGWMGSLVVLGLALPRWAGAGASAALPDLVPEAFEVTFQRGAGVNPGDVVEGCAGGATGRTLLRFSLRTRNLGAGDLVLGDPGCPDCATHPGAACTNPFYVCAPAHGHPHFEGYAKAELIAPDDTTVAIGRKIGFCVLDLECAIPQFTCGYQGLSAGCADVYLADLPCQYIDLTGIALTAGDYHLRVSVDPENRIAESDETNNTMELALRLDCDTAPDLLPVCTPNPFVCYATSVHGTPERRLTPAPVIGVRGTFGAVSLAAVRPRQLCTAASAGTDAVADATIELRGYAAHTASREAPRDTTAVRIVTQLGESTLDVGRLAGYAVPAVTDPQAPLPTTTASEHAVDRFACFSVTVPRAARNGMRATHVTVGDRFLDPPVSLVVKKPRRLCTPVATASRPMRVPTRHLLCHDVGRVRPPHVRRVHVRDELASRTVELGRPDELCLLAEKNPPVPVTEDLVPCTGTVDVWRFDARAGRTVDVGVDTTDSASAANLCAELTCGELHVVGDDERACTFAPPANGCPHLHGVATRDESCVVTVRVCGACASAEQARYLLRVAIDGEEGHPTLITDDGALTP